MPDPKKAKPDLDDDDLDEFFDDEDEDELDEEEVESLLDEEDTEEEEPEPPKKKREGSKRTPAPAQKVRVATEEDEDEDFDQAVGNPNTLSKSPALKPLDDDQLVMELADLILQGDDNEMVTVLHSTITGLRGGKVAKQLVREARDRAIAKIKRVANVAQLTIDYLSKDDD